ncbi:EF-hand domain-containing protein [Sphingorhabdus sp. EL138]|jgi:Ca2+-binding EF-hand superfamily protein|uniref:EF-hand domain-containing protein n=1 Tax=Sphingorhabdus sp. EL138 TaxID=2073156 RepID=UPI000D688C1C|nr:EF-hand domain-containing protein [Sphingorhabdus sp. EL138]
MRLSIPVSFFALTIASPALALNAAADRTAAQENFSQADGNEDGQLTKSEFRKFINANAADDIGRASTIKRFGAYDRAFERVDANKDGLVTPKELAASQGK